MAKEKSFLVSSDDLFLTDLAVMTVGPPNVGKTVLSCTASEKFPAKLGAKRVVLDDIALLAADKGATDGLKPLKLKLPHVIPMPEVFDAYDSAYDALLTCADQVIELDVTTIIVDTLTILDALLLTKIEPIARDNLDMYGHLANAHRRFYTALSESGKNLIFNVHAKLPSEIDKKKGIKQKATMTAPAQIIPDITGKSANLYKANVSMICTLLKHVDMKGNTKRVLYPYGAPGFEGGTRWEGFLDKEEPAHFGKLFAKIAKAAR